VSDAPRAGGRSSGGGPPPRCSLPLLPLRGDRDTPVHGARAAGSRTWRWAVAVRARCPPASSPTAARDGEEQHAEEGGGDASRAVWRG
jgi:hypothetical protein